MQLEIRERYYATRVVSIGEIDLVSLEGLEEKICRTSKGGVDCE